MVQVVLKVTKSCVVAVEVAKWLVSRMENRKVAVKGISEVAMSQAKSYLRSRSHRQSNC